MTKSNSKRQTAKSQPRVLQLLERIDRTLLAIQLETPTCQQFNRLIEIVDQINENLDTLVSNQEETIEVAEALTDAAKTFQVATEEITRRLGGIYFTLKEIAEQTQSPLPSGNGDEKPAKPKKKAPKLDKIDKEGFGKW